MISVRNLRKVYKIKSKEGVNEVVALNSINLDFPDKGLVFLLGKSGSGKSTLLNSIGGLDKFDSGEIIIKGKSSADFKQSDFDSYRNTFIGFIFQEYNILEEFTVGKNLALALELQGKKASKDAVDKLLDQVDLTGFYKRKPNQLSGGQKQRIAIARALIKDPEIIMADEPTGALDSATGKQVMETLKKLSKKKLVIIVSHDREFAEIYGDRVIELKDGSIIRDESKQEVVPETSESGVSYIDNSIIHIKKGNKISKDDFQRIAKMLSDNSENGDTIISFDQKSNQDIKKSAFINDEGNREVFKTTENVERKDYNPKDFKMIKSKLKFKDSFKMGASALKHKPIRLIFTILLSVFAFGMFGVVDTMASFNRADSVYETIQQLDIKTLAVNKNLDQYNSFLINDTEFNKFQNENKNYNLYKVIGTNNSFNINGLSSNNSATAGINKNNISGVMAINSEIKNNLNLNLTEGILPTQEDEIAISSHIFEIIKKNYNVSSLNDLQSQKLNISDFGSYKIVGVLQDDTRIDHLKNLTSSSYDYDDYSYLELEVTLKYGLVNMCYVSEAKFNSLYSSYHKTDLIYNPYIDGEDFNSYNYSSFTTSSPSSSSIGYLKEGYSATSLTGNQAVISKSLLIENLGMNESDLVSKINKGFNLSFCYGSPYGEKPVKAFTLQIVGYTNGSSEVHISTEQYNKYFRGADYIITRLKGNSDDKALVSYFENNNSKINFSVQCPSTPVLDNFGEIISIMANVLLYVGIGLAVFAGLMLMNFISVSISYKKREIGILRAIGARSKDVFSIFFAESAIICFINFVLSVAGSAIVCSVINSAIVGNLGISLTLMMFGARQVFLMLGVALAVAFISCFFPVFRFARKNPIDCINNR